MEKSLERLKPKFPEEPTAELLQEAADYFRSRPGFERFFNGLIEKYRSFGRLGGNVVLEEISDEERRTLEAFFRRRLPGNSIHLSVREFMGVLAETKFGGLNPLDLLTIWYGGGLITKQELREHDEAARRAVIQQFLVEYQEPACQLWLKAVLDKDPGLRQVQRAFVSDRDFTENMAVALRALVNLPKDYRRLPVFARSISGDPHGLDMDRGAGKLFLDGLRYLSGDLRNNGGNDNGANLLSAVEGLNELLYHFKLLRDDLLNFATCFGFAAFVNEQEIPYWRMASEAGAPLNIPLREIARITSLQPYLGFNGVAPENCRYNVFVVENSGVFSALLDEHVYLNPLLVCLHGQFKLASWALLDRLVQSGAMLRYSGDFDPEGLQMAQKLFMRYPNRVNFWRMTEDDYLQAAPSVPLDEARIGKLKSVKIPELMMLAEAITKKRLAAYQEGILELLGKDLKRFSGI